ncbi:hypothetical protein HIM_03767 [Hirsutella minnesotensis 3608]|uniref:Thioredoxin-like protein AAED1 n=1 Tax=Hirsutella minnesotensis 3608 TaxID=1043627 RepID=A0A0F7ZQA1_9HYPO|nr:hypothetical protein HIM_03767 [Hirsutella minnesotensis 3608]
MGEHKTEVDAPKLVTSGETGGAAPASDDTRDAVSATKAHDVAPTSSSEARDGANDTTESRIEEFDGHLETDDELPSAQTLDKIASYVVLDRDGRSHTFQSLYSGANVARRVLVVFVRHFFCGNCQDYLKLLCETVKPEALLQLPISTFVVIVGCGDPGLINMYLDVTKCPFPLYTDPTGSLYDELGMRKTLNLGPRPAYSRKSLLRVFVDGVAQGLSVLPKGLALKSGPSKQVGGEFLFEPVDMASPVSSPKDETPGLADGGEAGDQPVEEKRVTWCHRMRSTRDHAEIPQIMDILGLDSKGLVNSMAEKDVRRWSKAGEAKKVE